MTRDEGQLGLRSVGSGWGGHLPGPVSGGLSGLVLVKTVSSLKFAGCPFESLEGGSASEESAKPSRFFAPSLRCAIPR